MSVKENTLGISIFYGDTGAMIERLQELIPQIIQSLDAPEEWDSLIINKRKPHTYRVFRQFGNERVCLHGFAPCESTECFAHPHPWPGAFLMLRGSYIHRIGCSTDLESTPSLLYREIIRPYSTYEILDRRIWHSVQPLEWTETIMVNGEPWESPHSQVRTTKGKDLEKMTPEQVQEHFSCFRRNLTQYLKYMEQYGV
jgi:hypothetical protein